MGWHLKVWQTLDEIKTSCPPPPKKKNKTKKQKKKTKKKQNKNKNKNKQTNKKTTNQKKTTTTATNKTTTTNNKTPQPPNQNRKYHLMPGCCVLTLVAEVHTHTQIKTTESRELTMSLKNTQGCQDGKTAYETSKPFKWEEHFRRRGKEKNSTCNNYYQRPCEDSRVTKSTTTVTTVFSMRNANKGKLPTRY